MGHGLARKTDMVYVGQTPWHNLGVKLDSPPTVDEAIRAAGLDWTALLRPLSFFDDIASNDRVQVKACAIVRSDTGAVIGDAVGKKWVPMQNREAFGVLAPFVSGGLATIETAGQLFGGSRVWMLAKLNRDPITVARNDSVDKYLLIANGHDSSLAIHIGFTPVRVVCHNTLSLSVADRASRMIRLRHTKGAAAALASVAKAINVADQQFDMTAEVYRAMARRIVNSEDVKAYFRTLFPPTVVPVEKPKAAPAPEVKRGETPMLDMILAETPGPATLTDIADETVEQRDARAVSILEELFESGPGAKEAGRTAWGLYNAVTAYTSHHTGRTPENRASNLLGGTGAALNVRALSAAAALTV